jgi:hypothetical protein
MSPTSYRAAPPRDIKKYVMPTEVGIAWQRPTLPEPCGSSTLGAGGLNGRVRDGNAWFPSAIITKRCVYMFGLHQTIYAHSRIIP